MKMLFLPILVVLVMAAGCVPSGPITIVTSNQPPTAYIDSISPTEPSGGETVTFDSHGTDSDGTVVAYRWRSSIDGALSAKATFETSALSEGEHTIYLKVQDNNGDWSEEVSSTVIVTGEAAALPVVSAFGADPGSIVEGESSTLSWKVSGAATVSIDHGVGSVALTGTRTVSPVTTTTYTLTATNEVGSITATAQVTVSAGPPAGLPVIGFFTAEPGSITAGDSSTLSWNVSDATVVTIEPGVGAVAAAGSTPVSPAATTSYTLTATNATGAVIAVATVVVGAAPPAEQTVTLDPESMETGSIYSDLHITSDTLAGDTATNTSVRAYFSFDIASLEGVDVTSAEVRFTPLSTAGYPWSKLGGLWIDRVDYGERALLGADFLLEGTELTDSPLAAVPVAIDVTLAVQSAADAGDPRFQVRTRFHVPVHEDGGEDSIRFLTATLIVAYLE